MATTLHWGIIATGGIAHQFASGLAISKTGTLVASGSRDLAKAQAFAEKWGGVAYGSYEDVLSDPNVDAVYIATPHHLHAEWTIKVAQAGKAILCEKPFTLNSIEAERALKAVEEAGVFFMEAFMFRCAPQTHELRKWLANNEIGSVRQVNSEFGFAAGRKWDNFRADGAVGGGGLMDVGSYCVSLSRMVMGEEPSEAYYVGDFESTNYDASGAGLMKFSDGRSAHFGTGIHLELKNDARIYGDEGWIWIESAWKNYSGTKMILYRNGKDPLEVSLGVSNAELYMHEADAVAEYIDAKECPWVSIEDTRQQMRTLDKLRASANFKFAAEATE